MNDMTTGTVGGRRRTRKNRLGIVCRNKYKNPRLSDTESGAGEGYATAWLKRETE